jgi:hypothetical protein
METKTARIRTLNDELRKNLAQGHAVMTRDIPTSVIRLEHNCDLWRLWKKIVRLNSGFKRCKNPLSVP